MYRIHAGDALMITFHEPFPPVPLESLCATSTVGNHTTKIPTCKTQKKPGTECPMIAPTWTKMLTTRPIAESATNNQRNGARDSGIGSELKERSGSTPGPRLCCTVSTS